MSKIIVESTTIDFPIYNSRTRSLKNRLLEVTSNKRLIAGRDGRITVRALDNVSFTAHEGDRIALIGRNGSGKSTVLRMLTGVYAPCMGSVTIDGDVGSLIDISLGIDPEATGRDNVFLRGKLLGLKQSQLQSELENIIEFSGLEEFIDMPTRTYSSGMGLRLAFAISTIFAPDILVMDEWLSVGDENFKAKAEQRLKEMVDSTNILFIATHSRNLAMEVCNRAIWLEDGKIVKDGDSETVCEAYFDQEQSV